MPTKKELAFDEKYLITCTGYAPDFIDGKIKISLDSILNDDQKRSLATVKGNSKGLLNYCDLTILYNAKRKVPFFAAYNIDGAAGIKRAARPAFQTDPRIEAKFQLDDGFYDLRKDITEFEIGHMASNNEMGRGKNGIVKAYQTFHFTNSVPQAEKLNTGLWKGLESYIIKEAATVKNNKRICVFTGPILTSEDPGYRLSPSFKIPLLFFKVIVFQSVKGFYSTAFMMSHEKKMIEDNMFVKPPPVRRVRGLAPEVGYFIDFKYKKVFQVNITFLEQYSGLKFQWKGVKPVIVPEEKRLLEKIKSIKDAADAKKHLARNIPLQTTRQDVTKRELETGQYLVNMILP